MQYFIANTDKDWYDFLVEENVNELNFWQPSGHTSFRAISYGLPFLFKLKAPINKIAGVGFFICHSFLPISIAWDFFGKSNGTNSFSEFEKLIFRYRAKDKYNLDPLIGCITLTDPVFFKKSNWLPLPSDWKKNIVVGKTYNTEKKIGKDYWDIVQVLILEHQISNNNLKDSLNKNIISEPTSPGYRKILNNVRIGQAAFRLLVTDAYQRKCSVSGSKILPTLEAAHIKPYASSGPNHTNNGLLLRSDFHKLFDKGYITITKQLKIEVSRTIKEEFHSGKEYYKYHGNSLEIMPKNVMEHPSEDHINWHNKNIYKG